MEAFINFLVNNYLWFLIITLILIFALIGYLVDTNERKENGTLANKEENNLNVNMNTEIEELKDGK